MNITLAGLAYVAGLYALFGLTYIFFCAVMAMEKVWGDLHIVIKTMMAPFIVLGLMLDVAVNVVIGTTLFLEIPKEPLFTARLQRWKEKSGYRQTIAIWICERGLNPIDPRHC